MLNPIRNKNDGTYSGKERTRLVTTACPEDRQESISENQYVNTYRIINDCHVFPDGLAQKVTHSFDNTTSLIIYCGGHPPYVRICCCSVFFTSHRSLSLDRSTSNTTTLCVLSSNLFLGDTSHLIPKLRHGDDTTFTCKVRFCRVCGFRVRVWVSYKTFRSSGLGYTTLLTELTEVQGIVTRAYPIHQKFR